MENNISTTREILDLLLRVILSCASCHNGGGQDGRVWDLTNFGEGLRNTVDLRGRGGMAHGPLHWSGNFDEVQDFEGQIRDLSGGTGLMSDSAFFAGTRSEPLGDTKAGISTDLDALAAYVASLDTFSQSPYRNSNGTLTSEGVAGKAVFQSAQCSQCHSGSGFNDSALNNLHDIGTILPTSGNRLGGPLTGFDTPTLRGVFASDPYLHDGSASTLEDAVSAHSGVSLSSSEMTQLVSFLRQIDGQEEGANTPPGLTDPGDQNDSEGEIVNLSLNATDPDGDPLVYSAVGLPDGLSINNNSGLISGTLSFVSAGSYSVDINVSDGGASDSVSLTWTVLGVNQSPVLTNPGGPE